MAVTPYPARVGGAEVQVSAWARASAPRPGPALVGALIATVVYAGFAHGATGLTAQAYLQTGLALVALVAFAMWLWDAGLRVAAPATAWAGVGLLTAFAAWSALTLAWSVAPDGTWIELNRAITYLLVIVLALAAGAWHKRALELVAYSYLIVAVAAALYALGGKLVPGIHIGSFFDLNQTQNFARLRAPLQYWNALSLFCALAAPIALRLWVDERRSTRLRLAGLVSLGLLLVTMGLTYSRGGVVSLAIAIAVSTALGGARLRSLLGVALGALAAVPPLAYGFTANDLVNNGVRLSARTGEGLVLAALLIGALAALAAVGAYVLRVERRTLPDAERSRRITKALVGLVAAALLVGVVGITASHRGLTGTISDKWDSFRAVKYSNQYDPARLLSSNSGNRWVWWQEAVGAWSDRPLQGWGAGSFPVVHREYRTNRLDVQQPHSVPLQFLAETGLIGALLALGGVGLLMLAALAGVRRLEPGPQRALAAAVFGASVAWAAHGFIDWDWDIPGVTIPPLIFLGLLAARPNGRSRARVGGDWLRGAALTFASLVLCTVALSAILPAWAGSKATSSLTDLPAKPTPAQLRHAEQQAELSSRLDPVGIDGLLAAAAVAERRHHPLRARAYLRDAVARQPDTVRAWDELARLDFVLGDFDGLRYAINRALDLDPRDPRALSFVQTGLTLSAAPNRSATATGTPLPLPVADVQALLAPLSTTAPPPWVEGTGAGVGALAPAPTASTPAPTPAPATAPAKPSPKPKPKPGNSKGGGLQAPSG